MHISYYMWCIQPDILWEVILFCPDNCLATKNIQYRWDRISWCVVIILQRELRTPGVISLCHKMTLHMSVREPLYDVSKTLTEAFHFITIQLSFHNPNTDIVLQWTQPEICVTSWEVSPPSTMQGFNKYMHSISMRPCCMVCVSHFPTWGKHSQSYFTISYNDSPLYGGASYNVKWALSELFHYNMTFVSSMSPSSMAHGRQYAIEDKSFRSHVVIQ